MTPLCTTQQSQSRSKFHRKQVKILSAFLWLVEEDKCDTILERRVFVVGVFSQNTWMSEG